MAPTDYFVCLSVGRWHVSRFVRFDSWLAKRLSLLRAFVLIGGVRACLGFSRGETGGEGGAPPPVFHTLAKDMSKNRGATHFTLGLRPCIILYFLL